MDDERPELAAVFIGHVNEPHYEPGPVAPPRSALQSIRHLLGVNRMTLEALHAADAAITPRAEVRARLGIGSPEVAETCRQLDRLMDGEARKRSASWSLPLADAGEYRSVLSGILQLAALGLDIGQGPNGGAVVAGWEIICDSSMFCLQAERRAALWGDPIPAVIRDNVSTFASR